ncbi:MAG: hypothetical protein CMJ18_24730 [Phycisphaeraceae bacterium]|nr:hypothetical protein [Phycisphaeraceae bacterium]
MSKTPANPDDVVHHKPARSRRAAEPVRMTLNLTSMIDVIFLLLIYFVITAIFTPGEGIITARLPKGTGAGKLSLPIQPLGIVVGAAGTSGYRLEIERAAQPRDFQELYKQLVLLQYDPEQDLTGGNHKPDDPILIKPHGEVRWQHVVNAFNAAVRARYRNIQFAQAGGT